MASNITARITIDSSLMNPSLSKEIEKEIGNGLFKIAIKSQELVQRQLYVGHGFVTGHLRRSISAAKTGPLSAQFDAGASKFGKNVIYSYWVEGVSKRNTTSSFKGYRMFDNTFKKIRSDMGIWDKFISKPLMAKFASVRRVKVTVT